MAERSRWKVLAATRGRVRTDAADLLAEYGSKAEAVAAHMAKAERGRWLTPTLLRGHWGRVLQHLKRRRPAS